MFEQYCLIFGSRGFFIPNFRNLNHLRVALSGHVYSRWVLKYTLTLTYEKVKSLFLITLFNLFLPTLLCAQGTSDDKRKQDIHSLIDSYSMAREKQDTDLLKSILVPDIDQLVSTGEWRSGMKESISGMLRSSGGNPGTRRFIIEKIRFLNSTTGIVDARYEIQNNDGTARKMWSTFIVVYQDKRWKISAIRNMLPTTHNNEVADRVKQIAESAVCLVTHSQYFF